jgi:hypothetical protein
MAYEDNFLQLDPYNYDTELESLLATSSLSLDNCETLFQNGKISKEEFEYAKDWFEFYK